jgi:hypothetical protein
MLSINFGIKTDFYPLHLVANHYETSIISILLNHFLQTLNHAWSSESLATLASIR